MYSYKQALADAHMDMATKFKNTVVVGQGVSDHKEIFGSLSGFKFRDRIVETPLSEESVMGACVGMALEGLYPINTHIRSDFAILALNQLINHASKYRYMTGGLFSVPMMIRLVVGRSWGQGAQHSQSLHTILGHFPGISVVSPSNPKAVKAVFSGCREISDPVVCVEHRLLYDLAFDDVDWPDYELHGSVKIRSGSDITIVANSVMVIEGMRACSWLEKNGISVDLIDLHSSSNPDLGLVLESVAQTGRLIVLDTTWDQFGIAAELSRNLLQGLGQNIKIRSVSNKRAPCPTAKILEDAFYPDLNDIVSQALEILDCRQDFAAHQLPFKESITDHFRHFKGPF